MLNTGRCCGYKLHASYIRRLVRVELFRAGLDCHRLCDDVCLHINCHNLQPVGDLGSSFFFYSAGFSVLQG